MKKALALILALLMVFSLFACGGGKDNGGKVDGNKPSGNTDGNTGGDKDNSGDDTPKVEGATPNRNEDGSIKLDKVAHYDRNYDYTQNEKFKVTYIAQDASALYQMSADAYEHWAPYFNCEWMGFKSSAGDADMYMTLLQTDLDQGVQGFILDPDNTIFPTVVQLLEEYPDAQWMSQMSPPRDGVVTDGGPIGGTMVHPYVGFDNFDAGAQQAYYLGRWKEENLADVSWDDIGVACFTFSVSPPLAEREVGAKAAFEEIGANMDNYFCMDAVSGGLTLQGGIDTATPVFSTNDYKYWLVVGLIDDLAQGAATVLDQIGLTDNSCVVAFGGAGWIKQTDAGQKDAFRAALFTANNLYSEPILGAVYAFLMGWATPDTIWPSWVKENDHGGDDHTYSSLLLPTCWLEPDTYQEYLEWTDWYANANAYDYDIEIKGDEFSAFIDVPSEGYIKN